MFILRQIDLEGVNMNFALGKDYAVINREQHPAAYGKVSEIMFKNKNWPRHEPIGIVSAEFGDFFLNQNEQNYIMLESGKTFEKLVSSFVCSISGGEPTEVEKPAFDNMEYLVNLLNEGKTYFNDRFNSVKKFKDELINQNCLVVYLDGTFQEGEYENTDFFVFEGKFWESVRPTYWSKHYKCNAQTFSKKDNWHFAVLGEQEEVDFKELSASEHYDYLKHKTNYFYRKGSEIHTNVPFKRFKMKPCEEGMVVEGIIIDCDDLLVHGDPFTYSKGK